MPKYIAQVLILLDVDSEAEASDAVSGLLTENGIYTDNSGVMDWSYLYKHGSYTGPREVVVPDDYDRDEDDLNSLLRKPDE
jgi:hypothetical protein